MDTSEADAAEPVVPFELLRLTETHYTIPLPDSSSSSNPASSAHVATTSSSASGLISQSVELLTTMYNVESLPVANGVASLATKMLLESPFSPVPVLTSLPEAVVMPVVPEAALQSVESHFRLETLSVMALRRTGTGGQNGNGLALPNCSQLAHGGFSFQLDSIATLARSPIKAVPAALELRPFSASLDPSPFIHRSVSSPVLASSSQDALDSNDDSNITIILNGDSGKKPKKRKVQTSLRFPEAEPPAVRPRFQWYQGKGMVRLHVLVKNVSPCNAKIVCTGRNIEFRCKSDNCPYPPTRPEVPARPVVEYHLPLRLPHRLHPDPEFIRYSPSRIEVYYRKVKQHVEWSCLWKCPPGKQGLDGELMKPHELEDSSSASEDGADDSDQDEDMERPTKRFMNECSPLSRIPLPSVPENAAPITDAPTLRDQRSLARSPRFTVGSSDNEPDQDQKESVVLFETLAVTSVPSTEIVVRVEDMSDGSSGKDVMETVETSA